MHCHAHPPTLPEGSGLHLRIWLYTPLLREYPSYINYKFLFFFLNGGWGLNKHLFSLKTKISDR